MHGEKGENKKGPEGSVTSTLVLSQTAARKPRGGGHQVNQGGRETASKKEKRKTKDKKFKTPHTTWTSFIKGKCEKSNKEKSV